MPAPYPGNPNQFPRTIDCPVDADPPNASATTHPLQQLADRTANISHDLPKTGLANIWREVQRFLQGIVVTNSQANKPGVASTGGPGQGVGVIGNGGQGNGRGVIGHGAGQDAGVVGDSQRGPGGQFSGNPTRAALNLAPQPPPGQAANGDVYFDNRSGSVLLRTLGTWGAAVLTGKATTAPVILNGGASDDSPARQVTALPVTRKLVEEISNTAGLKTRLYSTPAGLELTTNCSWNSANQQWSPDTAQTVAATRISMTALGLRFQSLTAPAAPFWEVDWTDPAKARSFSLGADADTLWQGEHAVGAPGEPPFQGGWAPALRPLYFLKDALGQVHLTGQVAGGSLGALTPIFTLPAGYLPSHSLYRMVATGADLGMTTGLGPGMLVLASTGEVYLLSGDAHSVLLDLSFLAGF